MKRVSCSWLVVALLLTVVSSGLWAQDLDAALERLRSEDAAARNEAVAALAKIGPRAVGPLLELIGGDDADAAKAAGVALGVLVHAATAPGAAEARAGVAKTLTRAALDGESMAVRRASTELLAFIGGDDTVPALSKLLAEDELRDPARRALERIPGAAATAALAAALEQADDQLKAGLLDSLGVRQATSAVGAVSAELYTRDPAVRRAAIEALGRMPTLEAEAPLFNAMQRGPGAERAAARAAYLRLGEALVAAGEHDKAARMFRKLHAEADLGHERAATLLAIAKAEGAAAVPTLIRGLEDPKPLVTAAAREALAALPEPHVTDALVQALGEASPAARTELLAVLGRRGNGRPVSVLVEAAGDEDEAVRLAVVKALGTLGDPGGVEALVVALGDVSPAVAGAAERALSRMPGETIGEELVSAEAQAVGEAREALMYVFGARREPTGTPVLVAALKNDDANVRTAALEALRDLADPASAPALLAFLRSAEGDEARGAEAALTPMTQDEVTQALAEEAKAAPPTARAAAVRLLGPRRVETLRNTYVRLARDEHEGVAAAAREALGYLGGESVPETLLTLAGEGGEEAKAAAVRAYVRLADGRRDNEPDAARGMYHQALGLAGRDEERRQALKGLRPVVDVSSLSHVAPLLEREGTRDEAAAAAVPIADRLRDAGDEDEAIELYTSAAKVSSDRNLVRDAIGKIRQLGGEADFVADAGFVPYWWVLGPFRKRKDIEAQDVIPTDAPVDVMQPVTVQDKEFRWKSASVDDPLGMLDLEIAIARQSDCGGYAYMEMLSDGERDVVLKIGSDDAMWLWLNGEKIHEWIGDRGFRVDQDTARAHLKAGANRFLAKVTQGGGQWALGVRITDEDGQPLRLKPALTVAEMARRNGAVSRWWVLGPFDDDKKFAQERHFPVEFAVDVQQAVKAGEETLRWRRAIVDAPTGRLDLERSVADREYCGCYVYAVVESDEARDVLLKIGSDDAVICWLNGEKAHENPAYRPYAPDEDTVAARLKAGPNHLLLAISQGGGFWNCGVRITDPDGNPILLDQKSP